MTVMDLKKEIAALKPPAQDELAAFIVHLKHERDSEHSKELDRRLDDRNPENWIRLEDAEEALGLTRSAMD